MKKIFLFILNFIILCLVFSFRVSASYLPSVTPQTNVVPDFLQTVAQAQLVQESGVFSPYKPDINHINELLNGRSISNSMTEVYTDNSSIDWGDNYYFYDSNGNQIIPSMTFTAWGTSDIGNYSYVCSKETGEILGMIGRGDNIVSTLQAGDLRNQFPTQVKNALSLAGGSLSIPTIYQDVEIAKNIQNYAVYNADDLTQGEKDFIESYDFHLYGHANNFGWSVYVPNCCSADVVVIPVDGRYSYSGYVDPNYYINCPTIFAKNPQQVLFVGGTTSNWGYMRQESHSVYGQNFNYVTSWYNIYNVFGFPNGGYLDFRCPTSSEYNQALSLQDKFVYVFPVDLSDNSVNNEYYNYTYVTENPPEYNQYVNNNYDMGDSITNNNYPVYYEASYPNYTTENNYLTTINNYYTTPNQNGGDVGSIDDPILPENIPLLSNLEYRFPFCIPFDLYKIAQGLSVPRETPYIDTTIIIPNVNYEWHIQYDLHRFDDVAQLFRLIELILFIAGLAIFSYQHFFGS